MAWKAHNPQLLDDMGAACHSVSQDNLCKDRVPAVTLPLCLQRAKLIRVEPRTGAARDNAECSGICTKGSHL